MANWQEHTVNWERTVNLQEHGELEITHSELSGTYGELVGTHGEHGELVRTHNKHIGKRDKVVVNWFEHLNWLDHIVNMW